MMIKRDPFSKSKIGNVAESSSSYISLSSYCQGQESTYNLSMDKHQNTPRSDRCSERSECDSTYLPPLPWPATVRKKPACLKFGKPPPPPPPTRRRASLNKPKELVSHVHPKSGKCSSNLGEPISSPSKTGLAGNKKRFYNVMWDPRVARGSTFLDFTTAEKTKCKYELDLNNSMLFRYNRKRGRKNPSRFDYNIDVKLEDESEPLSYSSFAEFLIEQETVTYVERGQGVDVEDFLEYTGDGENDFASKSRFVRPFAVGVETTAQPDNEPCRESTIDWAVQEMVEKIPLQALLEATEELEIETLQAERLRYETVMLYRDWQNSKEEQWKEWLKEWEDMRREDIEKEEQELLLAEERMCVIRFIQCGISLCFAKAFEPKYPDGITKEDCFVAGVSCAEINRIETILPVCKDAVESYDSRQIVARDFLDATILESIVQRFSEHMYDEFGKPSGWWVSKRKGRLSRIAYDLELAQYLEGRGAERREQNYKKSSVTDLPLSEDTAGTTMPGEVTEAKDADELSEVVKKTSSLIPQQASGPHTSIQAVSMNEDEHEDADMWKVVDPAKLGRGTQDSGADGDDEKTDDPDNDVDLLYKRKTSWSTLENEDNTVDDKRKQVTTKDSSSSTDTEISKMEPKKDSKGGPENKS